MPFSDFAEAKKAFEAVIPGEATLYELSQLGFNLEKVSGSERWNSVRVRNYLLNGDAPYSPKLKGEARACLDAHGEGLEFSFPFNTLTRGESGFTDFVKREVGYQIRDRTTGARLWAWFCYDPATGVVLHKLRDEKPFIDELKITRDPFAPVRLGIIGLFGLLLAF